MPQMDYEMYVEDISWILLIIFLSSNVEEPFAAQDIRNFMLNDFFKKNTFYFEEHSKVIQKLYEKFLVA